MIPIFTRQTHRLIAGMSFSFGFSGDDVDDEMNDGVAQTQATTAAAATQKDEQFVGLPAREYSLDELVG